MAGGGRRQCRIADACHRTDQVSLRLQAKPRAPPTPTVGYRSSGPHRLRTPRPMRSVAWRPRRRRQDEPATAPGPEMAPLRPQSARRQRARRAVVARPGDAAIGRSEPGIHTGEVGRRRAEPARCPIRPPLQKAWCRSTRALVRWRATGLREPGRSQPAPLECAFRGPRGQPCEVAQGATRGPASPTGDAAT